MLEAYSALVTKLQSAARNHGLCQTFLADGSYSAYKRPPLRSWQSLPHPQVSPTQITRSPSDSSWPKHWRTRHRTWTLTSLVGETDENDAGLQSRGRNLGLRSKVFDAEHHVLGRLVVEHKPTVPKDFQHSLILRRGFRHNRMDAPTCTNLQAIVG